MATQKQDGLHTDSALGAADLTGKEMLFCTRETDGTISVADSGEVVAGVISEGKIARLRSSFNMAGNPWLRVIAGGVIAIGDQVQAGSNGVAISGGSNPFGRARSATTAAGQIVEVVPDRT